MTTRAGKLIYPRGPLHSKYAHDDCRYQDHPHPFSRRGGYLHVNHGKTTRAQRRQAIKEAHGFRTRAVARLKLTVKRASVRVRTARRGA